MVSTKIMCVNSAGMDLPQQVCGSQFFHNVLFKQGLSLVPHCPLSASWPTASLAALLSCSKSAGIRHGSTYNFLHGFQELNLGYQVCTANTLPLLSPAFIWLLYFKICFSNSSLYSKARNNAEVFVVGWDPGHPLTQLRFKIACYMTTWKAHWICKVLYFFL